MRFARLRTMILVVVLCLAVLLPTVALAERQGELEIRYYPGNPGGLFHMYLVNGPQNILYYGSSATSTVRVRVGSTSYPMTYVTNDPEYGQCLKYTGNNIEAVFDIASVGNPITGNSGAEADLAEFSLYITNTGSTDVQVGGLMFFDTMVGGNDQAPLYIPGVGKRINESTYTGSGVPATIYSYQRDANLTDLGLVAAFLTSYNGNIAPDWITLGNFGVMADAPYNYSATNATIFDSAILAQWSNRTLAAGASTEFSMFMGRGAVTAATGTALSLSASGDAQISSDHTFQVMQTVSSATASSLSDVQASISLPSGWNFAPDVVVPATRSSLAPGDNWVITWNLIAPAGATSASFPLSAQVGGDSSTLVSVTYDANNICAPMPTPSFSPAPGMIASGTPVTITSTGADHIYYTTDGSNPATSVGGSTLEYTGPITVGAGMTIKAIATKEGSPNSGIGSAIYSVFEVEPDDGDVSSDGIGTAVQPSPNVDGSGRVIIQLIAEPVSDSGSRSNIAIAEQSLSSAGQQIAASYDVRLFETIYNASNAVTHQGNVHNSRITGDITVRLPLPAGYTDAAGLTVVYIDDLGVVTPLSTTAVTIDGVQYLEFTTRHFSVYAIVSAVNTSSGPDYARRKLTDDGTGVTVEGYISPNAELDVNTIPKDATGALGEAMREHEKKLEDTLYLAAKLSLTRGYSGILTVTIPVGAQYNGQTITLLHEVNGKVETLYAVVADGNAVFRVTKLGAFALFTPVMPINSVGIPKTGSTSAIYPVGGLLGIAVLAGTAYYVRRRQISAK